MRPEINPRIEQLGIATATFLAVVISLWLRGRPAALYGAAVRRLLFVSLILGVVGYGCSIYFSRPRSREVQELVKPVWDMVACAFIVAVILTVLFATMFALAR